MTEAMERWPKEMLKTLLPRIYMIIEEIDRRYMNELEESKYDHDKIYRMSIIDNNDIKMANLSIVGSHSVNGVAKLHTELLKKEVLKDFYDHEPEKFNNKRLTKFMITLGSKCSIMASREITIGNFSF